MTAGVLIRRTLPAMAATLAAFVTARLAVARWIRPDLLAAERLDRPLDPVSTGYGGNPFGASTLQPVPPRIPNAWITSTRIVDDAGHPLSTGVLTDPAPTWARAAVAVAGTGRRRRAWWTRCTTASCGSAPPTTKSVTYQPAHRYWTLQWAELAIVLGLAIALAAASVWWVRRRLL